MDIFNVLSLIGGLSLFLFGMIIMDNSLEKRAGSSLKRLLGKLTSNKLAGFLTGLAVTAVIQSSSVTTVTVVGFVNSGLITLKQAINVIIGANVGTTVTAWILSLTGIDSSNIFVSLLKPSSFTPVLALIGLILYMLGKSEKKKDVGMVMLGFATLMFGMDTMSSAVSGLKDVPGFRQTLLLFSNPALGVLAGAVLTAIIQSSSASVGILQALSSTGQVTFGTAIPIILGQNIGTCVTAMISSIGANKNARRAAVVHLMFNVVGSALWLSVFLIANAVFDFAFVNDTATPLGIAIVHTVFNVLSTSLMLPLSGLLERLACHIVPDKKAGDTNVELDERLFTTPAVAVSRARVLTEAMATASSIAIKDAMSSLKSLTPALAEKIRSNEAADDHFEDIIGTYLVHLSSHPMRAEDSVESARLLHTIGDFERISDHAVNILESAEEMRDKQISFSPRAERELSVLTGAVGEIVDLAVTSFMSNDIKTAVRVEPLEQVVDALKEQLRSRHILRLQNGDCSIEAGFVWSDLLTDLERVADHCSNIAGCVIETEHSNLDLHGYLDGVKADSHDFTGMYESYAVKYALAE